MCIAAGLLAAPPLFAIPLNSDVAWVLFVGRRLLAGARPYVDIIDYQAPLVFILGLPVDLVSRYAGWPEARVVAAMMIALSLLSLWLVWRVLRVAKALHQVLIAATLVMSILTMLTTPARDLGQAEHLLLIALVPYVVLLALDEREAPRRLRIGIGLLASVGLALKPAFLMVPLILLVYLAWSRRRIDVWRAAEHLVFLVGIVGYALTVIIFLPEYAQRILPIAEAHDWSRNESFVSLCSDWMVLVVSGSSLGMAIAASWLTQERQWAALARVCALASLALLAAFFLQHRALATHFLPVRAFNFMAAGFLVMGFVMNGVIASRLAPSIGRARLLLVARTGLLTLLLVPPAFVLSMIAQVQEVDFTNMYEGIQSPLVEPLLDIVREEAAGQPIFVLSSTTTPAFPLVNLTSAAWPYRFKNLAFVSIYYEDIDRVVIASYRPPSQQSSAERALFDKVVEDLTRVPPKLLIVDRSRLKQGFGLTYFDFLAYYRQAPAFDALLRHYRRIGRRNNFEILEYQPSI